MAEWTSYRVGVPGKKGSSADCYSFDSVTHTAHVDAAIAIASAGEIRPSLVFDKSRLNDKRILVSWLSPNNWAYGFRYGNVRFHFSVADLVRGKKCYWVEPVAYMIPACRILVTDIDRSSELEAYHPEDGDGPWWYDRASDSHYFNSRYCLELMVEAAVSLDKLTELDFVEHHGRWCSVHSSSPSRCKELGVDQSRGGALFLTRAVVSGTDLTPYAAHFLNPDGGPAFSTVVAFNKFITSITRRTGFSGHLGTSSPASHAVVRACMSDFTFGRLDAACTLASLLSSEDDFTELAARAFAECISLPDWKRLVDAF